MVIVYVPRHFAVEDLEEIRALVRDVHVGQLVTVGTDGTPDASLLPVLWEGDEVVVHLARANEHWRRIVDGSPGLLVVTGPDAYITPRWYASKREHGRVVPTWNYSAVHLSGPVTVHDDPEWLREAVTRLTDHHEGRTADSERWHVDDAPPRFVDGQLRAIVGVSMAVTGVEAKAKLSQNRSVDDQAGVVEGLAGSADLGAAAVRDAMVRRQQGH
jgi:transcriptional regulator